MKIWPFSRSAQPVEQKSGTAVPDDWLYEMFGASAAGSFAVSASAALTVPAVAAAVRTISEAAATLDVKLLHIGSDGGAEEVKDHPVIKLLQGDVNDWTSGYELFRDLVSEALTHDAGGFAWVNRVNGEVREIVRYDPGNISVTYDPQGTGEPTYRLAGRVIPSRDVIHLRGPFARCPLSLARDAIGVAKQMEIHAGNLFQKGARPSGLIRTDKHLGDEGARKMLAGWRAAHEGSGNSGKTAVLWDGADWKPMTLTSVDAQFVELRLFQLQEIARAFNIPAPMLGDLSRATWSNSEQKGREFLSYCLEPWICALEGALRRALFLPEERDQYRIWFERDDLTRADLGSRATAYSSLIASRVLNPNEAREWEGLPAYEGGNEFANPNTGASQPGEDLSSNSGGNSEDEEADADA